MQSTPTIETVRPQSGRELALTLAAAVVLVLAAILLHASAHVEVLKAAGLTGGTAINGVANFINSIKSSILWLAATAAGLMAVVVGFLFMSGHSRAQDYAIKGAAGMMIIVAVPGIVS